MILITIRATKGADLIYNVNIDKLLEKIYKFDSFRSFTVIRMAFEFWSKRKSIFDVEKLLKEIFGTK
ncbi:hypothetical protein [Clostridium ljungdahlii]|uniref:Uncharacterized protein n=1 Tax=Clostridium ljungdahlii TaxID=1538 RepID=A0A168PIQ3_9CLOT|nr:hypothetical protein [Clostridium ljungdahlii]OAA87793.1 hypothetical protein WY13_01908 [Clostridium ljungdahlii]